MRRLIHLHQLHDKLPEDKYSHRLEITDEHGSKHWIEADVCCSVEIHETEDEIFWMVPFVRVKMS